MDDPIGLPLQNQGSLISASEGDRIDFALGPVGGDFSPAQFNNLQGEADNRATESSERSQEQDLAFLEDSSPLPQVPEAIRNIPPAIFKYFGDTIQEFDRFGRRQWLRDVEEPNCKPGTFAFCCTRGAPAPNRVQNRFPDQHSKTTAEEILRRRRKCTKCTFGVMAAFYSREVFFLLLFCSLSLKKEIY